MNKMTLGTDPEVFCFNRRANSYIPGFYALGHKDAELELPFGTLVADGMAVEFTVEPSDIPSQIVKRIGLNLAQAEREIEILSGASFSAIPRVPVKQEYIDALPVEYGKRASLQMFGCDPDFSSYPSFESMVRPDPAQYPYRTSGGHIHLGLGTDIAGDFVHTQQVMTMLDRVIGTASTYLCTSEEAKARKEIYGRAGNFRRNADKGTAEYRTLPAQAIVSDALVSLLFFKAAQQVGEFCKTLIDHVGEDEFDKMMRGMLGGYSKGVEIAHYINDHNIAACRKAQWEFIDTVPELANIIRELQDCTPLGNRFSIDWGTYNELPTD